VMQNCYVVGTRNITSQLLSNYLLRDQSMHRCVEKVALHIAPLGSENRRQEDNSIVTTRDAQTLETLFYRVHMCGEDTLEVTQIETEPYNTIVPLLWDKVGLKRYVRETSERIELPFKDIHGKGVLVQHILTEYQTVWLQSKKSC
jgi:hypothetical protein